MILNFEQLVNRIKEQTPHGDHGELEHFIYQMLDHLGAQVSETMKDEGEGRQQYVVNLDALAVEFYPPVQSSRKVKHEQENGISIHHQAGKVGR